MQYMLTNMSYVATPFLIASLFMGHKHRVERHVKALLLWTKAEIMLNALCFFDNEKHLNSRTAGYSTFLATLAHCDTQTSG